MELREFPSARLFFIFFSQHFLPFDVKFKEEKFVLAVTFHDNNNDTFS